METFFYVIGGVLVVLALGISFLGMRSDRFPSDAVLRVGLLIVALVVAATAFSAVRTSSDEQQHREDEQNREASSEAEQEATGDTEATGTPDVGGEQAPGQRLENDTKPTNADEGNLPKGNAQAGVQVFTEQGCASCHTLKAANATGTVGPDLDTELAGKDTQFIETSIVDPNAEIEKGFQANIMPTDFGDVLSPEDLANVVALLEQAASSNGGNADKPASGSESSSSGG
jgi:mono/diheme cytochrome c family protein